MKQLTAVIISDLHAGAETAPIPEGFTTEKGQPIGQTTGQKELTDAFMSLANDPKWHRPDILISLAEAIEGQNRKESGIGSWTTQPLDQVKAAEALLKMFDAKLYYVLQGSGYHVSIQGLPAEEVLARNLNAFPMGDGDYRSAMRMMIEEFGFRMHFAHHISTSQSDWYLTTPLAKEGIRIKLKERDLGHVDLIVRGHGHQWVQTEFRSQFIIACPAWKVPDPFLFKKGGEPNYDIGAVRFSVFEEPDDFGTQFRYEKRLFKIKSALPKLSKPSEAMKSAYYHPEAKT